MEELKIVVGFLFQRNFEKDMEIASLKQEVAKLKQELEAFIKPGKPAAIAK